MCVVLLVGLVGDSGVGGVASGERKVGHGYYLAVPASCVAVAPMQVLS